MPRILFACCLLMVIMPPSAGAGDIQGTVSDSSGLQLPGASVIASGGTLVAPRSAVSDSQGRFVFPGLAPGKYVLTVSLDGFQTLELPLTVNAGGGVQQLEVTLAEAPVVKELVNVVAETDPLLQQAETAHQETMSNDVIQSLPAASQRFQDAIPLLPSVVRGSDGQIHIGGSRSSENSLLLNGAKAGDPVSGSYSLEIPTEAIEEVQVSTSSYAAENGGFSGGITRIVTKPGQDRYKLELNDFLPRVHFDTNLKIQGIESWTPRVRFSGPIRTGNLYFSQAFHYLYERAFLDDLDSNDNSINSKGADSLTQIDYIPDAGHRTTLLVSVFPRYVENLNLNTFMPAATTPDLDRNGMIAAIKDVRIFSHGSTLESTFHWMRSEGDLLPKENTPGVFTLSPEGYSGRYFDRQYRLGNRYSFSGTYSLAPVSHSGDHLLKIGMELTHSTYEESFHTSPTVVQRSGDVLYQLIRYTDVPRVNHSTEELSMFVQDQWTPFSQLTLDLGLRFDYSSISGSLNPAPRFGFSYAPSFLSSTVFKGGIGIFYDKILPGAAEFQKFPQKTVETWQDSGSTIITHFKNRIQDGLKNPRSITWNLQVERLLTPKLVLRTDVLARTSTGQTIVNPMENSIVLSSTGKSRYEQWELTTRYRWNKSREVNASYVLSSAKGDLNTFENYFGTSPQVVLRENEYSDQPFDARHRVLVWGVFEGPARVVFSPLWEIRSGFPYSVIDEFQQYFGAPNRQNFPIFSQVDIRISKTFRAFGKYDVTAGFKVFNIMNKFNPRDVQNNLASPRFGTFYNGVGRKFRGILEIRY